MRDKKVVIFYQECQTQKYNSIISSPLICRPGKLEVNHLHCILIFERHIYVILLFLFERSGVYTKTF